MCAACYQHWKRYGTVERLVLVRHTHCTIEGCQKPADRKIDGLCEAHYYQKRRHGQVTSVEIKPYGTAGCKEPGCGNPHASFGWCQMHYTRWQRHGDQNHVGKPAPRFGEDNNFWRGDAVGYGAVHDRTRRLKGPAGAYGCTHCGGPAEEWAYDHTDPDPRQDPTNGLLYSVDPTHYIPLCKSCHRQFDADHRGSALNGRPAVQRADVQGCPAA